MESTTRLDAYIARLLYDYDCVIVPQLGGFVTNYRPARFDEQKGVAHPPGKDIRFNRNLTKSDGLLTRALADATGRSFEQADETIHRAVENYLTELEGGKRVTFEKVGVLYYDDHRILRFSPDHQVNFLKDSIGFTSFAMPELPRATVPAEQEEALPRIDPERETVAQRPRYSKGIYGVAAATLLPFIGFSIFLGLKTDFESPSKLSLADILPVRSTSKVTAPLYGPRETKTTDEPARAEGGFPHNTAVFPFSFETNAVDSSGVWIDLNKVDKKPASPETADVKAAKAEEVTADVRGLYHIIAGCFGERSNAEEFVDELVGQGYPAAVLDHHKNLFRVRLKSYTDFQTALGELRELRSRAAFSEAWMLKKQVP